MFTTRWYFYRIFLIINPPTNSFTLDTLKPDEQFFSMAVGTLFAPNYMASLDGFFAGSFAVRTYACLKYDKYFFTLFVIENV